MYACDMCVYILNRIAKYEHFLVERMCLAQSSPQQPTYLCVTEVVEHIAGRRIHDATSTTSSCGASSTSDSVCWSRFFWDTGIHVFFFGSLVIVLVYH